MLEGSGMDKFNQLTQNISFTTDIDLISWLPLLFSCNFTKKQYWYKIVSKYKYFL